MSTKTPALRLHPDRLLPADPALRTMARHIYDSVRDLPIVSPHGHVDPRTILDDEPFGDPTALFVTPDHYVTRLLHASGVPLDELGVAQGPLDEASARRAWHHLCSRWDVFRGTPVRYWLESELAEIFDVAVRPSAPTSDLIYDQVQARLAQPQFRPRALFQRFGIEVLATTDDPVDDLAVHAKIGADDSFPGRVVPTFRPDRHLEVAAPGWVAAVDALEASSGVGTGTYRGWVAAMEDRREYFRAHGAVSTDHSHVDVGSEPLGGGDAERIYAAARAGTVTAAEGLLCAATCSSRWPAWPRTTA
ncbi:hypothetical protein GCM10025865_16250 [Paraoerskovia sediminicola]|uniref:Uronate isomerase n=1 Tax=Paraoerskovia sediminicola TaxID=1138587 RepID=A0ABM8G2I5_9CELL|nr:hypothetical protein GCM10025865_16250 [Paraoerskovia sediminicola]